jgi:cobalt-zinc-cadmium efflux system outer membrane protein
MWAAFVIAACVAGGVVTRAQERARTPAEILQLAIEQNRDLLAARQRVAEAQGLLRQAGVRLNPTVEIEGATGRPFGTKSEQEYSAGYFQPIELGAKRDKRIAVGQYGVTIAQAELDQRTRQLVFDVKTSIAALEAAEAKHDALSRQLTAAQASARLTRARVAEGDAAALEEQLLLTEIARTQAQLATFRGRRTSALIDLQRVAGLTTSELLVVSKEPPTDHDLSLPDLQSRALSRPDLQSARAMEAQAVAAATLARAGGVPDLTVFAKYSKRTSAFEYLFGLTSTGALAPLVDHDNVLSWGVSIPVFAPGRNQGNAQAAFAHSEAARLERERLESAIPQQVAAAYQRWVAARQTVALFRTVMEQSEKNLGVMRQAYELGQLRLLDVLNEQRRLIDTELSYIDAQTELAEAAADLERVVGSDLS